MDKSEEEDWYTNFLLNRVLRNKDEEVEGIPGVKGRIPIVHCGENSRIFRDAADQTLPVTVYSEIDNWILNFWFYISENSVTGKRLVCCISEYAEVFATVYRI